MFTDMSRRSLNYAHMQIFFSTFFASALEELRTGGEGTNDTEEELEQLRQELKQKEKELTILRSRFGGDELNAVKVSRLISQKLMII